MYKIVCISLFFLSSCFNTFNSFNNEFYEKTSGIKLPAEYEVLESIDNGEFITATVFRIDSLTLLKFSLLNHFDSIPKEKWMQVRLTSDGYFHKFKPDFHNNKSILFIRGEKEKNSWTYVADLKNGMLWAEIWYPDWSGN